jgi:hypothetical protein
MHIELSSIHCDEKTRGFFVRLLQSRYIDGPAHSVMSLADLRPLWLTGIVP